MGKRFFLAFLLLFVSFGLFGCWEDFFIPSNQKKTTVGGETSKDWRSELDSLLKEFVNEEGLVDYAGIKKKEATVNRILASIAQVDPKGWDDRKKLAFWINAYNIAMIWNILDKFEETKAGLVSDFSELFFNQRTFEFAGQTLSLNQLEHNVIRRKKVIENISVSKVYPEIHAAVFCAALSCPPLRATIWRPETVIENLDRQMRKIANDKRFLSLENGKVSITSLVDWYNEDFRLNGGTVGDYFADRVKNNPPLVKALREAGNDKSKLVFKKYDWTLNNWVR